ncbi:transcription factor [Ganoderma sinense ZZ0214-1]|uniref:Postreplication repair E3 ubiquitin-protein ligase RAD18 n=1 Tax=Ganoderma sinense ZZ0214-1 TaxID=1077348 RepID=A0A2G8S9Z2_9APHY|nr:transcription factor [Ganoderma sinense ZZ0214-1]
MASMLDDLLAQGITDSTDFPDDATTPGLRSFDDALRCGICRDFYDAPVSLACGHCFCSACIRSALPEKAQCPTCRKEASESQLRRVVAVESAVHAWKAARDLILRFALEEERRKSRPVLPSLSQTRKSSNGNHSERLGQKRRRRDSPLPPSSDDEIVAIPSSPAPSGSSTPDISSLPDLVECPVCQKDVLSSKINMHLDSSCKKYLFEGSTPTGSNTGAESSKSKQKQQWSHLFPGSKGKNVPAKAKDRDQSKTKTKGKGKGKSRATPDVDVTDESLEHLPKVAYDIHPRQRISEMLAESGLPTHGDKNALARRHARWLVLYNANIDRDPKQRHTLDHLRQELKAEEAEGRTKKETVDDVVAYQKANKGTFAKLTEAARPKKPIKVKKAKEGTPVLDGDEVRDPGLAEGRNSPAGHEVIDVDDSES